MDTGLKTSGGEGGIRTLGTGVSPYNGLAILCLDVTPSNPNHLQSSSITKDHAMCLIRQFRDTARDSDQSTQRTLLGRSICCQSKFGLPPLLEDSILRCQTQTKDCNLTLRFFAEKLCRSPVFPPLKTIF